MRLAIFRIGKDYSSFDKTIEELSQKANDVEIIKCDHGVRVVMTFLCPSHDVEQILDNRS